MSAAHTPRGQQHIRGALPAAACPLASNLEEAGLLARTVLLSHFVEVEPPQHTKTRDTGCDSVAVRAQWARLGHLARLERRAAQPQQNDMANACRTVRPLRSSARYSVRVTRPWVPPALITREFIALFPLGLLLDSTLLSRPHPFFFLFEGRGSSLFPTKTKISLKKTHSHEQASLLRKAG